MAEAGWRVLTVTPQHQGGEHAPLDLVDHLVDSHLGREEAVSTGLEDMVWVSGMVWIVIMRFM